MTAEEKALEKIESYCKQCRTIGEFDYCADCIKDTAKEAIKKQIPKRYIECEGMTHLGDTLIGFCPACGEPTNSELPFCPMCGQAIEWSEKE